MNQIKEKKPKYFIGLFSFYRFFVRPILFLFDAEEAHENMMSFCRFMWKFGFARNITKRIFVINHKAPKVQIGGIEFQNPVGLAAGFDKNAVLIPGIENLGFGFIEVGTVTPRPQVGNPRPRIRRESAKRAIVNRLSFPSDGAAIVNSRLKVVKSLCRVPIGVNIAKNRDTPNNEAVRDYEYLVKIFYQTADYFALNISSPNTPGLRNLQSTDFVEQFAKRTASLRLPQPIFLKLSPELSMEELRNVCDYCGPGKPITGLILTNTIPTDLGGLSGWPLKDISLQLLVRARTLLPKEVPIISVGGIETAKDAKARLEAGASAIQIYSTMIYQGPSACKRILKNL